MDPIAAAKRAYDDYLAMAAASARAIAGDVDDVDDGGDDDDAERRQASSSKRARGSAPPAPAPAASAMPPPVGVPASSAGAAARAASDIARIEALEEELEGARGAMRAMGTRHDAIAAKLAASEAANADLAARLAAAEGAVEAVRENTLDQASRARREGREQGARRACEMYGSELATVAIPRATQKIMERVRDER